ncbi:MAG: hypothetical protein IJ409_06210 [Lachnospiraceae bacterium]|nr:hypothetical protein [Lachnospiraceae bacterium]
MSKKIVVSFPGSRGSEIPLLYFGAKHYEDLGYEKVFINHPAGDSSHEAILKNAEAVIDTLRLDEYEEVIFIAKSLGTVVACMIKEKYQISVKLVLFTPVEETLPYIRRDNDILLVAAGTKDRYLESSMLKAHCERENINCYIEENVGHRMEVMNDLKKNLQIVYHVIEHLD